MKKIDENCKFRSDLLKTDIRLDYDKDNKVKIEPVINVDLLYNKDYASELERLIRSQKIDKKSSLNDVSLMIKLIQDDSQNLKRLNREIEDELNKLNLTRLDRRVKNVKKKVSKYKDAKSIRPKLKLIKPIKLDKIKKPVKKEEKKSEEKLNKTKLEEIKLNLAGIPVKEEDTPSVKLDEISIVIQNNEILDSKSNLNDLTKP